jgi:hypothetical protein
MGCWVAAAFHLWSGQVAVLLLCYEWPCGQTAVESFVAGAYVIEELEAEEEAKLKKSKKK